jgi:hypothetical protein
LNDIGKAPPDTVLARCWVEWTAVAASARAARRSRHRAFYAALDAPVQPRFPPCRHGFGRFEDGGSFAKPSSR